MLASSNCIFSSKNANNYLRGGDNTETSYKMPYRSYDSKVVVSKDTETFTTYEDAKFADIPRPSNIYYPIHVCYVNVYRTFNSNSTTFDYTKEYDNNIEEEPSPNKLYFVLDDRNIVYYIEDQNCIYYPNTFNHNDEL